MTQSGFLVHGTAIVAGTTGILFVGPSGSGKSRLALETLFAARRADRFAALIADDQVWIENINQSLIASAPESIRGLAEIRGSAIVSVPTIGTARLNFAVATTRPGLDERLPPAGESIQLAQDAMLPLLRLSIDCRDPFENLSLILAAYQSEKNV
jgi:hypothetical protein